MALAGDDVHSVMIETISGWIPQVTYLRPAPRRISRHRPRPAEHVSFCIKVTVVRAWSRHILFSSPPQGVLARPNRGVIGGVTSYVASKVATKLDLNSELEKVVIVKSVVIRIIASAGGVGSCQS